MMVKARLASVKPEKARKEISIVKRILGANQKGMLLTFRPLKENNPKLRQSQSRTTQIMILPVPT